MEAPFSLSGWKRSIFARIIGTEMVGYSPHRLRVCCRSRRRRNLDRTFREAEAVPFGNTDLVWEKQHVEHRNTPLLLMRLDELSAWFGDREWLEGSFSAADILMICVLRRLENLLAYVDRGKARLAFKRAYDAQLAVFTAAAKN